MKKFIIAVLLFAGTFSFANAQTVQKKEVKKTTTTTHMKAVKPATKDAKVVTMKESKTTTHVKKDGTADKRFKENKTVVKTVGPVKKDGTPDKRFKANKK